MVRALYILATLFFLAISLSSYASQVLRVGGNAKMIAISHDSRKWSVSERVCVYQGAREITCGIVNKVANSGAIVVLDRASSEIAAGDEVRLARRKAPLLQSVKTPNEAKPHRYNLGAGLLVGFNFIVPILRLDYAVGPRFAIGLSPFFLTASSGDSKLTGLGGYLTASYYSQDFFRGFWFQGGLGTYMFSVTTSGVSESQNSFAGILTVGWRGYWDLGLNIGVGVGAQYISVPNFSTIEVKSSGFQPTATLDLSFNF